MVQGVPKEMVQCICCMFLNNALFLLGSWKKLKTLSRSSFNSEWKIVHDNSERWKFEWLMKEIAKGDIIIKNFAHTKGDYCSCQHILIKHALLFMQKGTANPLSNVRRRWLANGHASGCWLSALGAGMLYNRKEVQVF